MGLFFFFTISIISIASALVKITNEKPKVADMFSLLYILASKSYYLCSIYNGKNVAPLVKPTTPIITYLYSSVVRVTTRYPFCFIRQ